MQPMRMIFNDLPDYLEIPKIFQHRKVEVILWPLDSMDLVESEKKNDLILSLFGSIPEFPEVESLKFETREELI